MGCGRVGSSLATELEAAGHTVAVIDQAREAFRRLGPDFKGRTVTGVGFDREVLLEAGIQDADAFAAVSNGDNSNILAARVARETYGVQNVVARIYDPGRAEIYQRLGIPTVATGMVQLCEMNPHNDWYGRPILLIDSLTPARVAFITRLGEGLIPDEHTVLQQGDLIHVMVSDADIARTEEILASSPEGERQ
jgi:trk system potassium uptake protein TrkA